MKTNRTLAIVAISSLLACVGCLGGAYALATSNDSRSKDLTTREIPWDGSGTLSLGIDADVRYVQSAGPATLTARGPHRNVSALTIESGHVQDHLLHSGARLEITVTAPAIHSFSMNARSRLTIVDYDQPALTLTTEGFTQVEAAGRAAKVLVNMQGRSTANLTNLATPSVEGRVAGRTTLVTAPAEAAVLEVRDSATVILLTTPAKLETSLIEAGRVIHAAR
jgi:hypothetical protein